MTTLKPIRSGRCAMVMNTPPHGDIEKCGAPEPQEEKKENNDGA